VCSRYSTSMSIKLNRHQNRETGARTPRPNIDRSSCSSVVQSQNPVGPPRLVPALAAATARSALHARACSDGHRRLSVGGCGAHALLDLAGHGKESLLDVGGALCGGLEEGDAEAVCELLLPLLDVARVRTRRPKCCLPLLRCTRRPSCPPYRTCCRPGAC
jgi:hypothetical protein